MFSHLTVGVLALQGDFERHLFRLKILGALAREIRRPDELDKLDALIIPGGESSTMSILIDRFDMRDRLAAFCASRAAWGTCAGMIMLAREVDDARVRPLGMVDISVARNAYGRQVHSFHAVITASLDGAAQNLSASFIRAPQVVRVGAGVTVLAEYQGQAILLRQKRCLVSSFHTELDEDLTLTKYFLDRIVSVDK